MERDLHGVRCETQHLADLPGGEIRTVPQRDEISPPLIEEIQGGCDCQPFERTALEEVLAVLEARGSGRGGRR